MRVLKEIVQKDMSPDDIQRLMPKAGSRKKFRLQHALVGHYDFSDLELNRAEIYNSVLTGCDFRGAILCGAMLGEVQASGTDLRGAVLTESDVIWSDLRHARFSGAKLSRIYFFNTNLFNVSFRDADLTGANFLQCDLSEADFTGARLEAAQFVGCTLDGAQGLRAEARSYQPVMFSERTW
jgi:uncharacterized protein YjbI with pentapeptide repeats